MISVTVVSGFLGAGKTTWLDARTAEMPPGSTLIVNEIAPWGIDDATLSGGNREHGAPDIIPIVGGCVCCTRRTELRDTLVSLVDRSRSRPAPASVVIETTGLASLAPLVSLITEDPVLGTNALLASLVVVVDGVTAVRDTRHRAEVREQVRLADRLVVSKADLLATETLTEISAVLRRLNPGAELWAGARGVERRLPDPPGEALARVAEDDAEGSMGDGRDPQIWIRGLPPTTSWAEFSLWMDALNRAHPDRILRAKGTVPTPAGALIVQSVRGTVMRPSPAPESARDGVMVFITDGIPAEALERSFTAFVPSARPEQSIA